MVWWARGPALKEGHLAARVGSLSPWMLCFPCCGLCHLLACSFSLRHTASVLTWGEPLPPQGGEAAVAGAGGRCPSHECANRKRGREGESWPPGVDVFRKAASSFMLIPCWFSGLGRYFSRISQSAKLMPADFAPESTVPIAGPKQMSHKILQKHAVLKFELAQHLTKSRRQPHALTN